MAMSQALSEEEFHRMQVRDFAVAFLGGSGVLVYKYCAQFNGRHRAVELTDAAD